jgi:mannose-6-phosphate isomerase-like protein (cupin superfamily)
MLDKTMSTVASGYELVDFSEIAEVACPCGSARRAFGDVADFPATIHATHITLDARRHYHKRLTETYYFLECGEGARMELDDESIPVRPGQCILIRPGTRHRAVGEMKVLIVCFPKFDPADEWFD